VFEMREEELKAKVEFYCTHKISVHIETDKSRFYNGLIAEYSDKSLVLRDRIIGDIFIMFSEIIIFDKDKRPEENDTTTTPAKRN